MKLGELLFFVSVVVLILFVILPGLMSWADLPTLADVWQALETPL